MRTRTERKEQKDQGTTRTTVPVAAAGEDRTLEALAEKLYLTYCSSVGGVAFNGDVLPGWAEFRADPKKEKQAEAWRQVARHAEAVAVVAVSAQVGVRQSPSRSRLGLSNSTEGRGSYLRLRVLRLRPQKIQPALNLRLLHP